MASAVTEALQAELPLHGLQSLVPGDPKVAQRPGVGPPGPDEPSLATPPRGREGRTRRRSSPGGSNCLLLGVPHPHLRPAPSPLSRPAAPPPRAPRPSAAALALAANGRQPPPANRRRPRAAPGGGAATGPRGRTGPAEGGAGAGPRGGQLPPGRAGAPRPRRREGLRPLTSPGDGRQRGGAGCPPRL